VFVVPKDVARGAISRRVRTYHASDLLLVAEVVSPRSGSEQIHRVQKVGEYAKAGIPLYWIIELDPDPKVTVLSLGDGAYELAAEVRAGHVLSVENPSLSASTQRP
jgi:Uma2 family endonuclease